MRMFATAGAAVVVMFAVAVSCDRAKSAPATQLTRVTAPAGSWETGSYNPALVNEVMQLRTRLRADAATQPAHPFAGEYFQGDGLGVNLTLDIGPSGEYTQTWYGCLGLYYLNHGTITSDGRTIELHPRISRERGDTLEVDHQLVCVPWGRRVYLIAPREMKTFVEWVNKGREPRDREHGIVYLKVGHEKFPADGDPELPDAHVQRLFQVLRAKVIKVGDPQVPDRKYPNDKVRSVTLDVGTKQGVDRETSLRGPGPPACSIGCT